MRAMMSIEERIRKEKREKLVEENRSKKLMH